MTKFKLAISMVPAALWGQNLRKQLSQREWNRLRADQFEQTPRCEFCNSSPVGAARQAHEEWAYNVKTETARLVGLRTTCRMCHFVEHRGFVGAMVAAGRFTPAIFNEIERHFCAVNNCGPRDYRRHCEQAQRKYDRLMRVTAWTIDFGSYAHLMRAAAERHRGTH